MLKLELVEKDVADCFYPKTEVEVCICNHLNFGSYLVIDATHFLENKEDYTNFVTKLRMHNIGIVVFNRLDGTSNSWHIN